MTPEERASINRRIAESLGQPYALLTNCNEYHRHSSDCEVSGIDPDYFTSEEHSAQIFEAMPCPDLYQDPETKMWFCFFISSMADDLEYFDADRKTAVVKAYCGFIGVSYANV